MQLDQLLHRSALRQYLDCLKSQGVPPATINRKLASIRKFTAWARPASPTTPSAKLTRSVLVNKPTGLKNLYQTYTSSKISSYLHLAILVLFSAAMAVFGYSQIFKEAPLGQAYPQAPSPATPNRYLSFQARLTDSSDNPITTPTDVRFMIYNDESASGSAALWEELRYIDPDADGIFSVTLGTEQSIASSVFTENVNLWLGVTVETDAEATPRQRIATVGYALNAETLQGFPPSASASADQIPVLTQEGDLVLAAASPMVYSSSGTFGIKGQALSITTDTGTNGDITISPDGTGQLLLTTSTTTQNSIRATNANLTSGHLISGYVGNDTATGDLLNLSSGASETEKFTVDRSGNVALAGDLTITGGNITNAITADSTLTVTGGFTASSTTTFGGIAYTWPGSQTASYVLQTNGSGTLSWVSATGAAGSAIPWVEGSGILYPKNSTVDLLVGGQATTSAKFAVLNMNTGTPVASMSSTYWTSDGTLATTARQSLTIGNSSAYNTTGNVLINSNGTGNVGIGTTTPNGILHVQRSTTNNLPILNIDHEGSLTSTGYVHGLWIGEGTTNGDMGVSLWTDGTNNRAFIQAVTWATSYDVPLVLNPNGGNVGIGTTAPDARLEINHATGDNLRLTYNDSNGSATAYTDFSLASDGDLTIDSAGNNVTLSDAVTFGSTTTLNSLTYTWPGSQTASYVLQTNGSGTLSWVDVDAAASGTIYWNQSDGALFPKNSTVDLLIGGQATTSAKFAFINVNSGTPTATISGNLSLQVPTTADPATKLNIYNGGTFGIRTSVGGDTGLAERITILNNGYVGIGDSAPDALIDISSPTGSDAELIIDTTDVDNSTADSWIRFREGGSTKWRMGNDGSAGTFELSIGAGTTKTLLIDSTTGYMAIGPDDSTPDSLLHIVKDQDATTELRIDNTNAATSINHTALSLYDGSTLEAFFQNNNNTHTLSLGQNHASGQIAIYSGGGEKIRINASGYLGLNTTAPTALLDIAGTASSSGTLAFRGTTNPMIDILNGENFSIGTSVGGDAGLSERLTITNGGNVGIGTTDPQYLLDVAGDARLQGTTFTDQVNFANGTTYYVDSSGNAKFLDLQVADTGNPGLTVGNGSTGFIKVGGSTISDNNGDLTLDSDSSLLSIPDSATISGTLTIGNGQTIRPAYGPLSLAYKSAADTWATGLTLQDTTGNVGIGTTGPSGKLQVTRTDNAESALTIQSTGNTTYQSASIYGQYYGLQVGTNDTSSSYYALNVVSGGTTSGGGITGGTSRLFVRNDGNVGIGTAVPNAKLQVVANSTAVSGTTYGLSLSGSQSVANTGSYIGIISSPTYAPLGEEATTLTGLYGYYAQPTNSSSNGTVTSLFGGDFVPQNTSSGTVGTMYGVAAIPQKTGTGNITTSTALFARVDNTNATGTITNAYGLYIADSVETGTITNDWGIYQVDTGALNYFGGKVGIGTTGPSGIAGDLNVQRPSSAGTGAVYFGNAGNYLYFNGSQFVKTGTAGWGEASDQRIKTDIKPLGYGLTEILQLEPKKYVYHNSEFNDGGLQVDVNGTPDLGLIAQDVYQVIPEIVQRPTDESQSLWTLNYTNFTPIIINAIKELNAKVEKLTDSLTARVIKTEMISPLQGEAIFIEGNVRIAGDATISGTLTASKIESATIDSLREKIEALADNFTSENSTSEESVPATSEVDINTLNALNELLAAQAEASNSADYIQVAAIDAQTGFFSEYLAVLGRAVITDLQVTSQITLTRIAGLNGSVDLAGNLNISGDLTVEGNVNILGELTAPTASFSALLAQTLTAEKAKIDELTTSQLVIAASSTSEESVPATSEVSTSSASITTNATAGKAVLPAGATEYTIYTPRVDANSLVYVTPTGDPQNQVLYVKSKDSCAVTRTDLVNCAPKFTIAINQALPYDLEFNWWIIKLAPATML